MVRRAWLLLFTLWSCAPMVHVGEPEAIVPGASLPKAVDVNRANNNLDVIDHDGRTFLAFRTAPTHFASSETRLYVVSSADGRTWSFEASYAVGSDLREPRFFSWRGRLQIYFARLGSDPTKFEPGVMLRSERRAAGEWSKPEPTFDEDFIPWRIKVKNDRPILVGYSGGAAIYDASSDPIDVYLLTTEDGDHWVPLDPERPIVHSGGGSETDIELDAAGDLYAVMRNEAGDHDGFGSKICTAKADALSKWTCRSDPRKLDSPLLVREGREIYVIARRNLTADGAYDLNQDWPGIVLKRLRYQADYSLRPKRCAVWRLDKKNLAVDHLADLPSRGDTCFPSAVRRGQGKWIVYDYSSPLEGERDPSWIEGQLGPTMIHRVVVGLSP
jgi:hypothetical protein